MPEAVLDDLSLRFLRTIPVAEGSSLSSQRYMYIYIHNLQEYGYRDTSHHGHFLCGCDGSYRRLNSRSKHAVGVIVDMHCAYAN